MAVGGVSTSRDEAAVDAEIFLVAGSVVFPAVERPG